MDGRCYDDLHLKRKARTPSEELTPTTPRCNSHKPTDEGSNSAGFIARTHLLGVAHHFAGALCRVCDLHGEVIERIFASDPVVQAILRQLDFVFLQQGVLGSYLHLRYRRMKFEVSNTQCIDAAQQVTIAGVYLASHGLWFLFFRLARSPTHS